MKIYDIKDKNGQVFAFEVDNLTINALCKAILSIPGAKIIKMRSLLSELRGEEEVCEFDVDGVKFIVHEDFGDNSRYWIGTNPPNWSLKMEFVKEAFACANPKFDWLNLFTWLIIGGALFVILKSVFQLLSN